MKRLVFTLPLALAMAIAVSPVWGQVVAYPGKVAVHKPKKIQPIRTELSVGYRLATDGWGLFVEKGYVRSEDYRESDKFHNMRIVQIELDEHKDPKEEKTKMSDQQPGNESTRPFTFGKINNFYALKIGYGFRKMIAGKPEEGTVSIHWVTTGGIAVGMEKPYYLDGYVQQDNPGTLLPATFKYSEETKASFLNPQYIRGRAGFSKGLDEIQFVPGIHLRTGLHFDFSNNRRTALAIETGIAGDYYTKAIQIMANQEAKPYFVNLFVSLQFGRRW